MEWTVTINDLTHPLYQIRYKDWLKWRIVYRGGDDFKEQYLQKFNKSEDHEDFEARKKISYPPSFSKAALIEVRNSIYQRMVDISREGGSPTYQEAIAGRINGVDLEGSNMNTFMGIKALPELLSMGKVGIYVDMPPRTGTTLISNRNIRPYLYIYKVEDIRSWDYDESPIPNKFRAVLLRDYIYDFDPQTRLPKGQVDRFRFYWIENNQVYLQMFNNENIPIDINNIPIDNPILLEGLTRIPFICLEFADGNSLLADIADYQIALLNLASADMAYAIGANFPFYTEQFDPRFSNPYMRRPIDDSTGLPAQTEEVEVGPSRGRRYPINTDRPAFIHPSSEPMKASMEKQEQLKIDIRLLINLAISNIQPKMASAESKGMDERTLESGLSYIGLLLEDAERQIADIWRMYEGGKVPATVNYPEKYDLRSDDDRRSEAISLRELLPIIPSNTYQRSIAKRIVNILLSQKVSTLDLKQMYDEIDNAKIINVIPDILLKAVDQGLLDRATASEVLGYPQGVVEQAQIEQAARLALIQKAQTNPAARGIPDASVNPADAAKLEKQGKQGRGNAPPIPA